MDVVRREFETGRGTVHGIQVTCPWFNVVWIAGAKGLVACAALSPEACDRLGVACAIARSSPDNPIRTLDDLLGRDVRVANAAAGALGIREGMPVREALEHLAG